MDDLIRRSELEKIADKWEDTIGYKYFTVDMFRYFISKFQAVDAVPVVRCKDCVHWLNEDGLNDHVCLKIYSDGAVSSCAWQERKPDDFCSYGERKET